MNDRAMLEVTMTHDRRHKRKNLNRGRVAVAATISLSYFGALAATGDVNISKLEQAAVMGDISKEIELAGDYFVGRGVPQDAKMAAFWYEKAAKSGDPGAENEIGFFYQTGTGVPTDLGRALHWYQLSAASDYALAKVNLGVMYARGIGVAKNESLGVQFFKEAAALGSGVSNTYLGDMYYLGIGVKQDKAAGEAWYAKGVKMHDPLAEFNMGSLLTMSHDHPKNLPQGAKLLRQSAGAGYVPAMHALGLLLTNHPELTDSRQEARTLLEAAAGAGSWKSSVVLGILARDRVRQSASSGYVPAMHSLGLLLTNHLELADSRDEARPLLEIAAAAGCWKSSVVLGTIARDGHGESGGAESAFYHFQVAVLQGGEEAKRLLSNDLHALEMQLKDEKRSSLKSDADAWYSKHHAVFEFVFQDSDSDSAKWSSASSLAALSHGIHEGIIHPVPPS